MEEVFVLIDSAIPCGLIVNELISNVYKHAYPDDIGEPWISCSGRAIQVVTSGSADHGVGVPPTSRAGDKKSSGSIPSCKEYLRD